MPQCTQLLVRRGPHEAESAAHQSCGSIGLEGAETSATGIPDAGTQEHAWLPLSAAGHAVRLPYCVADALRTRFAKYLFLLVGGTGIEPVAPAV